MAIERDMRAVDPAGSSILVKAVISDPATDRQGDVYVSLCLLGLDKHSHTVHGSDPWQAFALAMQTAGDRLSYYTDMGWKFFWLKESPEDIEHQIFPEDMDESWPET